MRYYSANLSVYEGTRAAIDAAWQFPAGETCIEPAANAPKDESGNCLVAIRSEHCEQEPFKTGLQNALANGARELTEEEYLAITNPPVEIVEGEIPEGGLFP